MDWMEEALEKCLNKIERNITEIGEYFPQVAYEGRYNQEDKTFWTAGFWPGLLWLLYRESGNTAARDLAVKLEEDLDEILDGFVHLHHDVGFMWLPSAVMDYRLTGSEQARIRGLKAASHLAGRFNQAGRFIRAWTDEVNPHSKGWALIDCMMNLPLLFWASRETDDPRFYHIACAHTDTVLNHFIREDFTVPHIVSFDPYTGEKIGVISGQAMNEDSAWSRGQAWAIYGLAVAYRETGKKECLDAAKNMANYFLSHLPSDQVPYWDFRSKPELQWVKDSSAAACTASGLMELSSVLEDETEKKFYQDQGKAILKGLYDHYWDTSEHSQAMLLGGTVNCLKKRHINVPIIYGDFFFTEGLLKAKGKKGIF